jgi:wyosine [tRNA(Phe)-imidazoG37] synthetase (radical SAM superfamily)
MAFQIFDRGLKRAEYLIRYEGNDFAFSGDVEHDILGITAVRPMREDAIHDFLKRGGATGR